MRGGRLRCSVSMGVVVSAIAVLFLVVVVSGSSNALDSVGTPNPDGEVLRPDSAFVATEEGYVREAWKPPDDARPVVFTMDGYEGATGQPSHYLEMRDGTLIAVHVSIQDEGPLLSEPHVRVTASIRGTGCSGGMFDVFDRTHAWDGREVVEWLADQAWTTEKVAIQGHSYGGLTAMHIASTGPPSLDAVVASGLIGDIYRGVAHPGGVKDMQLPTIWGAVRASRDLTASAGGLGSGDEICAQNIATRDQKVATERTIGAVYTKPTDGPWYHHRSLVTYAEEITVPTLIAHAWSDNQTGPRGGSELFRAIDPDPVPVSPSEEDGPTTVPKQFLATTHGHVFANHLASDNAGDWFDRFLLGEDTGVLDEPKVQLFYEPILGPWPDYDAQAKLGFDAFPPEDVDWTSYYFREDREISTERPGPEEGSSTYVSGTSRQSSFSLSPVSLEPIASPHGPDELTFTSPQLEEPTVIAGPVTATLHLASTGTDTNIHVSIHEEDGETGDIETVQRGLLKASHRDLDEERTLYNDEGAVIRPYHPHTNPSQIEPGTIYEYKVEIFPVSHVLEEGDRLVVELRAPPAMEGLWGYPPAEDPSLDTLHHDAENPSKLSIPTMPWPEGASFPS